MSDLVLNTPQGTARFDPACGRLTHLRFAPFTQGALHIAPWIHEPPVPGLSVVEQGLAGDFFCAPFGASDGAPIHGWSANSPWEVTRADGGLHAHLTQPVRGARLTKHLRFAPHAPALLQTHRITGGVGYLPVAHHPMLHCPGPTWISFSPKASTATLPEPLEPGRAWLAPGQRADLKGLRTTTGARAALTAYPESDGIEDFVLLVERDPHALGWTAVIREDRDDMVLILKDARHLPATMLWFSNGGRDYPPWSGRHRRVLGIEDGHPPEAHADLMPQGRAALRLGDTQITHHAILQLPRPPGWRTVSAIGWEGARLKITGPAGSDPIWVPLSERAFHGGTTGEDAAGKSR